MTPKGPRFFCFHCEQWILKDRVSMHGSCNELICDYCRDNHNKLNIPCPTVDPLDIGIGTWAEKPA